MISGYRLLLFLLLLSHWATAQATFEPDERAYYGLINRGSGRCLDIAGASTTAGANAVQWEFTHAPSQQWHFVRIRAGAEYYRIEARHSKLCLTVDKNGARVTLTQRAFTGSEQQQWRLVPMGGTDNATGSFQLENRSEGRVASLSTVDKFNGTPVVADRAGGRASQQWRLFRLRLNLRPGGPGFEAPQPLATLNTTGNELAPVLAPDGKALYFARTKFAGNTEGSTDSGDAWLSQSTDQGRTWSPPTRLDAINTPQNNALLSLTGPAGGTAIVRGTYERDGTFRDEGLSRIPRAALAGAGAKGVRPTPIVVENFYSATPATGFFMTADEKILLLSLERADAQGSNDLYVSRANGSGGFSEPVNLGDVVNSPGYEFAPWLTPDGKTLYFASYGHLGYGSADIFVSERLDDSWTRWSEPQNLGQPMNGPGFDAYLSLTPDGETAYFAAGTTPTADYNLYQARRAAPVDSATANPPLVISEDNRGMLSGAVLNEKTRQPIAGAEVKASLLPNAQNVQFNATGTTDARGGYQLSLLAGRYAVSASSGGLLTVRDTLLITASMRRDLLLRPAAVGASVDLASIIFAQGKAGLLAESYAELNRLAVALQDNPATEVRLEGHTDNVGPADKNQTLSEQRVQEVKRYLVSRGVAAERISTIGYGGSRPRYANTREETRRLNRRVEMVIVK